MKIPLASQVPAQPPAQHVEDTMKGIGLSNTVAVKIEGQPAPVPAQGMPPALEYRMTQAQEEELERKINLRIQQMESEAKHPPVSGQIGAAPVASMDAPTAAELGMCQRSAAPHQRHETKCKGWVPLAAPASPQIAATLEQECFSVMTRVNERWADLGDAPTKGYIDYAAEFFADFIRTKLRAAPAESDKREPHCERCGFPLDHPHESHECVPREAQVMEDYHKFSSVFPSTLCSYKRNYECILLAGHDGEHEMRVGCEIANETVAASKDREEKERAESDKARVDALGKVVALTEQFLTDAFGVLDNLPMTAGEFLEDIRALAAQTTPARDRSGE
jgi:hypothetical protein